MHLLFGMIQNIVKCLHLSADHFEKTEYADIFQRLLTWYKVEEDTIFKCILI